MKRVSEYECTYQLEMLLALCDEVDMTPSTEERVWLTFDYDKECVQDIEWGKL